MRQEETDWVELSHALISRRRLLHSAAVGAVGLGGIYLAGCGGRESAPTSNAKGTSSEKKIKTAGHTIAGVFSLVEMTRAFRLGITKLGSDYTEVDFKGDPQLVLSQADQFRDIGYKAVVGYLTSDALVDPYVRKLAAQGIAYANWSTNAPWVIPSDPKFSGQFIQQLATPGWEGTLWVCRHIFTLAGGEGEFLHVKGLPGAGEDFNRTKAVNQALSEFPGIKKVGEGPTDWSRGKAQSVAETLITAHSNVKVIFGNNDDVGVGIVNALKATGKSGVIVGAGDGIDDFLKMIESGEAHATTAIHPTWVGTWLAAQLFDATHGHFGKYQALERMLNPDGLIIDTAEAAKAYRELVGGEALPYDVTRMSRVLRPDDYDNQNLCTVYDPEKEWGSRGRNVPRPPGFQYDAAYGAEYTPDGVSKVNALYKTHHKTDVFAPVRAMAKYQGQVVGTFPR